jgi:hypothetical protein
MSKGILIDTENRTITEVEVVRNEQGSQLQSIYEHVKCSTVEVVQFNDENDVYVDEEGLLSINDDTKFFKMKHYPQPIAGNGLIMGFDFETGENGDTDLTIEEVKNSVTFMSAHEVAMSVRFGGY